MGECKGNPGELLYEYTGKLTQMVEYGIPAAAVLSGQTPPPAAGARFDAYFEGVVSGPKMQGTVRGVDYLYMRADGRSQLHIHAEISTADGKKIAFFGDGVATPEPGSPVFQLRENVTLTTNHPEYAWVNTIQIWAAGTVDVSKGELHLKGYAA